MIADLPELAGPRCLDLACGTGGGIEAILARKT